MVNMEAIDVVVGCVIVDDFVQMRLDLFQLEGVAGCSSEVTLTAEFGSWKTSRLFAVARSEDLLTTKPSFGPNDGHRC